VISRQENGTWVLVGAITLILLTAFLSSVFSYVGMANPRHLPNGIAVITGFLGVMIPLGLSLGLNRKRRASGDTRG
jgi:uncharacterized membrane protein